MALTYSIGVDLGGTNLRLASYAEAFGLMDTISLPTRLDQGRERVVPGLCEAICGLKKKDYEGRVLAGVGITNGTKRISCKPSVARTQDCWALAFGRMRDGI